MEHFLEGQHTFFRSREQSTRAKIYILEMDMAARLRRAPSAILLCRAEPEFPESKNPPLQKSVSQHVAVVVNCKLDPRAEMRSPETEQ